jgi:acyl-CoA thioesterase-1
METKKSLILVAVLIVILFGLFCVFQPKPVVNYPSAGTDIIAFGDSLIQGVGASESKDFVTILSRRIGRPIINLGHAGDTTFDGIARIDELDKYKPKIVILLLGGNDYLKKLPILDTEKNIGVLIREIQSRGAIVLLLGVRGGIINDRFGTMFGRLRDKYRTAYVPDVLRGLIADMKYMSDAVHPNNNGYAIIANKVYPVLVDLIK